MWIGNFVKNQNGNKMTGDQNLDRAWSPEARKCPVSSSVRNLKFSKGMTPFRIKALLYSVLLPLAFASAEIPTFADGGSSGGGGKLIEGMSVDDYMARNRFEKTDEKDQKKFNDAFQNVVEPILRRLDSQLPNFAQELREKWKKPKYLMRHELPEMSSEESGVYLDDAQQGAIQTPHRVLYFLPGIRGMKGKDAEKKLGHFILHELIQAIRVDSGSNIDPEAVLILTEALTNDSMNTEELKEKLKDLDFCTKWVAADSTYEEGKEDLRCQSQEYMDASSKALDAYKTEFIAACSGRSRDDFKTNRSATQALEKAFYNVMGRYWDHEAFVNQPNSIKYRGKTQDPWRPQIWGTQKPTFEVALKKGIVWRPEAYFAVSSDIVSRIRGLKTLSEIDREYMFRSTYNDKLNRVAFFFDPTAPYSPSPLDWHLPGPDLLVRYLKSNLSSWFAQERIDFCRSYGVEIQDKAVAQGNDKSIGPTPGQEKMDTQQQAGDAH